MKSKMAVVLGLAVIVALFATSGVYAWRGGSGMGYGPGVNAEDLRKFQKETLSLRDELMARRLDLQSEYAKDAPDADHVATMQKEIIDLQTKIRKSAEKYGVSAQGPMRGRMGGAMAGAMAGSGPAGCGMAGRGMMSAGMGQGMGMGSCPACGWQN